MPRLSVFWVMLQRVPPDMRILTPGLRFFSSSNVRRPPSAARIAAISPAPPAPTTTTSHMSISNLLLRCQLPHHFDQSPCDLRECCFLLLILQRSVGAERVAGFADRELLRQYDHSDVAEDGPQM